VPVDASGVRRDPGSNFSTVTFGVFFKLDCPKVSILILIDHYTLSRRATGGGCVGAKPQTQRAEFEAEGSGWEWVSLC
jgi:hypothetical protein